MQNMCGRFYVEDDEALEERIRRLNRDAVLKKGDIKPGQTALTLLRKDAIQAEDLLWGFAGMDKKRIINARSETANVKPMFRELMRSCRLLIPAHGYYEWDSSGAKHRLGAGGRLYLAGLYRPDERTFTILTREAAPSISHIHPRMPVLFRALAARAWLEADSDPGRVLADCETTSVMPADVQMRLEL